MAEEPLVVPLSELFRRPDDGRRSREEAIKRFGYRAVWVAELNEALTERLTGPRRLSIPPSIFVSYRWGTSEDDAWVGHLVTELRNRGYAVTFDRTDYREEITVSEFVSRIADCQTFLAVLDPGYGRRIGTSQASESIEDGWVFDEYNSAAFLAEAGHVKIIGLLRSGDALPPGFRLPAPGKLGNAADVRDPSRLQAILDRLFPKASNLPPREVIEQATALIQASHHAAADGRLDEAFALAINAAETIPQVIDGYAQQARLAVMANRPHDGLRAARRALKINPESLEMFPRNVDRGSRVCLPRARVG